MQWISQKNRKDSFVHCGKIFLLCWVQNTMFIILLYVVHIICPEYCIFNGCVTMCVVYFTYWIDILWLHARAWSVWQRWHTKLLLQLPYCIHYSSVTWYITYKLHNTWTLLEQLNILLYDFTSQLTSLKWTWLHGN